MVRIVANTSALGAKRYFTESLDRGDYYSQSQEIPGRWGGKAAERLGMSGDVQQRDFSHLCENRKPETGEPLTERTKDKRRVGYDINFHCPKSVSVLHAITGDEAILEAFTSSVGDTMRDLEAIAQCRVRKDGAQTDRTTGNLIWALFVHKTARPIDGVPDPHLHAHCFTFNATWDEGEQKWKAGQFGDIKRDAPLFEAMFHSRFAQRMEAAGYAIEKRGKFWEVAGVPQHVNDLFSRRTSQIEHVAAEMGITDPDEKSALGARTRQSKSRGASGDELPRIWESRIAPDDLETLRSLKGAGKAINEKAAVREADKSVLFALEHAFERQSALREQELLGVAVRHGFGKTSPEAVKAALGKAEVVRRELNGQTFVTTQQVIAEERRMLAFARDGRGQCRPLVSGTHTIQDNRLNSQQQKAIEHVLGSYDRVIMVRGGAGTGKTTLMKEAIDGIQGQGLKVFTLAPSADASRGVLRNEGFTNADTVAKFLSNPYLLDQSRGQVLWIDEAGLLGTRTMARLFDAAKDNNNRVILSGDWRQHRSVERGDAMRMLYEHAGVRPVEVKEIQRQRGAYRSAVEHLAEGRMEKGFDALDKMGAIREVSEGKGHNAIARDFLAARQAGKSALIVCPTHDEGKLVNAAVRKELRDHGLIGKKDREAEQLFTMGFTVAEKKEAGNYSAGQVVRFNKKARGFGAGERTDVLGVDPLGNVLVKGKTGPCSLARHQADRFDVFDRRSIDLTQGDSIRFTRNGKTADRRHALNNGASYTIKGFTNAGDIVLGNGWVVDKHFGHFSHGYCTTSPSSQGKTVDRVLIPQNARSLGATSPEQFYVSVTRGRESCTIYTDNKEDVRHAVCSSQERLSAADLQGDIRQRLERAKRDEYLTKRTTERDLPNKKDERER